MHLFFVAREGQLQKKNEALKAELHSSFAARSLCIKRAERAEEDAIAEADILRSIISKLTREVKAKEGPLFCRSCGYENPTAKGRPSHCGRRQDN